MPTLLDRTGRRADDWATAPEDLSGITAGSHVLLSLAQWQAEGVALAARGVKLGVLLAPADDPQALAPALSQLSLIAVDFPAFTDGRGYSTGRLLRDRYGWKGELRAVGDIGRDQLFYLSRVGFDSFALRDGENADEAVRAFADFSEAYQTSNDRGPLFERRVAGVRG